MPLPQALERSISLTISPPKGKLVQSVTFQAAGGRLELQLVLAADKTAEAGVQQGPTVNLASSAGSMQAERFTRDWLAQRLNLWKARTPPASS